MWDPVKLAFSLFLGESHALLCHLGFEGHLKFFKISRPVRWADFWREDPTAITPQKSPNRTRESCVLLSTLELRDICLNTDKEKAGVPNITIFMAIRKILFII